jgi:hypothetical protein
MISSAYATGIQSLGNSMYFGDPLISGKQFAQSILFGGFAGGIINGSIALYNGKTFLRGFEKFDELSINYTLSYSNPLDDGQLRLENGGRSQLQSLPDETPLPERIVLNRIEGPDGQVSWHNFGDDAAKGVTSNPFKGKTFSQIDEMFKAKGFDVKVDYALKGKGSYISPNGNRYWLDKGGMYKKGFEGPHVDIWYNGHPSFEKVKFFLDGSPKMYTPLK